MTIGFDQIPANLLTIGIHVEFDNSLGGVSQAPHSILVLGTRLPSGTVQQGIPMPIVQAAQGETYFGRGSLLADMLWYAKKANPETEMWAIGLDENPQGVAAQGLLTFVGTATASGAVVLYVAGRRLNIGVSKDDKAVDLASRVADKINGHDELPVQATAENGVVTCTCRWKGETGNFIDLRIGYHPGEELPAGITCEITPMQGGTVDPDLSLALEALGGTQYHTLITPYTDAANLSALESLLEQRWGPMVQTEGHAFAGVTTLSGTSKAQAHLQASNLGNSRNSPFLTILSGGLSPMPPWAFASVTGALDAFRTTVDVNRPRQTMRMLGLLPPRREDAWDRAERQLLLEAGVSTHTSLLGTCFIERLVTTYKLNAGGFLDTSYQDVITMRNLAYLRFSLRSAVARTYPDFKLADDAFVPPAGSRVVRPKDIRALIIGLATGEWRQKTLVHNLEQFKKDLLVEKDPNVPGRINVRISPTLIGGFRVMAARMQFRN